MLRDQVLKAICGLHNSEGGVLVIGVRDEDREVTGIELDMDNNDSLEQKEDYRQWLRNIITSGCAFYPQINLCLTDLKWSNKKEIILQSVSAEAWSKDWPNRKQRNITMNEYNKDFNWLNTWRNNHFKKLQKRDSKT